jgi:hypothetical protein
VIAQFGRSIYGLVGAKVNAKTLELLSATRTNATAARVLWGFGQSGDGRPYLAYQLSKAAISGGVITVPSAMKEKLGGKFSLYVAGGRQVGTLVSKNGCAWGLGPVLRGHSAAPGDYLLLHFNVHDRKAQVHIGDERVLESVAAQSESV